ASQAYMDANVDDLEDEDYVPGSPGEFADEESQQAAENIHVDVDSPTFRSPRGRNGITYKHAASRRKHRLHGTPSKRARYEQRVADILNKQPGQSGYASDLVDMDLDQLPSISSLLGSRNDDDSTHSNSSKRGHVDPFDIRGVLPFSFMRDISMDNSHKGNADENTSGVYNDIERNNTRRWVLTSSSSDDNLTMSDNGSDLDSLPNIRHEMAADSYSDGENGIENTRENVADMFSDHLAPPPEHQFSSSRDPLDRTTARNATAAAAAAAAAQRLGSVIHEFAAIDSDSDTDNLSSHLSSRPAMNQISKFHTSKERQTLVPFNSSGSQFVLRSFRSGTQFGYRMWISNGGLRRVMKRLCGFLESEKVQLEHISTTANASTAVKQHLEQSATSYNYGDILRIDISATAQEFAQAYTTLLILWYEALSLAGQSEGQARELSDSVEADVLRWIEFTQQYMMSKVLSKSALAQLVVSIVECTSDGIAKLEQLDTKEEYNLVGAAYIGFSFAVALLQLAFAITGVRGNSGLAGPRAIGEDDELPIEWEPERFGPEIDKCLQVIIRLLSIGLQRHDPFRLGNAEQIWVALLHIFSSGSQSTSSLNKDKHGHGEVESCYDKGSVSDILATAGSTIVRVSGVWPAVQRACKGQGSGDFQYSDSLWAAFAYILPLSQVSDEGIAAPRTASQWRPRLASMADIAVENQLAVCLKRSAGQKQLRASDEALVRKAFVRIHSAVVDHGIAFGPNSHVYISMYRYLESNSFRSLSIEPLPSLPRFFTRYCGSIKRESSPSDTCTMLWLKTFDMSLSEWNQQLRTIQPTSKPHRHLLRNVRSAVSKMLPTRILTFDSSESRAQLSTLANYYAVFLFFLHAMPSGVVRSVRLYTQFQALLRFKESANPVARRVYFEAWSAAAMIIARSLRQILESSGHVGSLVEQLVGKSAVSADARDYYDALAMAVNSWGESVSTVIGGCFADDQRVGKTSRSDMSWNLADVAFMYLQRVLASDALAGHAPTMLILVHSVLDQSFLIDVIANSPDGFGSSSNAATANYNQGAGGKGTSFSLTAGLLERLLEIVRVWQDTVSGRNYGGDKNDTSSNREETREQKPSSRDVPAMATVAAALPPEREDNSQAAFAAFDSTELMEVTAEIEEVERQASFAA
ncbi:hypothetical protein GGH99_003021, partial [Coemansia sp. RSA 1285]